jgi:hypothetical protein
VVSVEDLLGLYDGGGSGRGAADRKLDLPGADLGNVLGRRHWSGGTMGIPIADWRRICRAGMRW